MCNKSYFNYQIRYLRSNKSVDSKNVKLKISRNRSHSPATLTDESIDSHGSVCDRDSPISTSSSTHSCLCDFEVSFVFSEFLFTTKIKNF